MIRKRLLIILLATASYACGQEAPGSQEPLTETITNKVLALVQQVKAPSRAEMLPDFSQYGEVKEKKAAFFKYMNPHVRRANDEVWSDRSYIRAERDELRTGKSEGSAVGRLAKIADRYNVDATGELNAKFFDDLLARVDVVPASLVLAQAANESAWGTSRFAREGNNLFGIWCFNAGCGLTPQRRETGTKHEVRIFRTVKDGIAYYIHTINTGRAYSELRKQRATYRKRYEKPTGFELAAGLTRYSQRGDAYVKEIRKMIRQNKLAAYSVDRALLERE